MSTYITHGRIALRMVRFLAIGAFISCSPAAEFRLEEATIADIHRAIQSGQTSCTGVVEGYIDRAKAYNGVSTALVTEDGAPIPATTGSIRAGSPTVFPTETVAASSILPDMDLYAGLPIEFGRMRRTASDPTVYQQYGWTVGIPGVGQVNTLTTLNIRGERSVTCRGSFDAHPSTGPLPSEAPEVCEEFRQQPDALERAAELDAEFGSNPDLNNLPMYCITGTFKDVIDTRDIRTTANGDIDFAMDAPPFDATIVSELRAKGAIIYAKASAHEYNGGLGNPGGPAVQRENVISAVGAISSWSGQASNPYDTEREPRGSSSGSGVSVAANLAVFSICEQTGGSCKGPASRNNVVNMLTTHNLLPGAGGIPSQAMFDRFGITARTVGDAVWILDALKHSERGYFDSGDIYTALPKALVSDQAYSNHVVTTDDLAGRPLEGMRIGIVREYMVKHTQNDVAISDQLNDEIKMVLGDQLGAELVESVDPLYPDDPEVPEMTYTFQDAFAEMIPRHIPEYLSQERDGDLEFAVPGHDVTSYDYLLRLARGEAPLSDALNLRRITSGFDLFLDTKFTIEQYLARRGDERVRDWQSLYANAKWRNDAQRRGAENWLHLSDLQSDGRTERIVMRFVARLALLKVMHENNLDAFVAPENTLPPRKIGGSSEPPVAGRGAAGATQTLTPLLGIPEIVVPAGYNRIVYEPQFQLSEDRTTYFDVTGTEESMLPSPMPISLMFWAGPGDEPTLIKIASAYEAATRHRVPPPDFGPVDSP
jgi:amidase